MILAFLYLYNVSVLTLYFKDTFLLLAFFGAENQTCFLFSIITL